MAWDDKPTGKQIYAICTMASNFRRPMFENKEIDKLLEMIDDRKKAAEVMLEFKEARAIEERHQKVPHNFKWYNTLFEIAKGRLIEEQIARLEKIIKQHPESSMVDLWNKELDQLKEEREACD